MTADSVTVKTAFVVPNPASAKAAPQARGLDPFIVKLNDDRQYNLLKTTKGWTLQVKTFSSPVEIVNKDSDTSLMRKVGLGKGADVLAAGVKVYQYTRGMMHAKYVLVDGEWASVGSANTDNRSLFLNFECNAQFFDGGTVREMEDAYLADLEHSVRIDPAVFASRPLVGRLAENAARLFSPVL